MKNVGSAIVAVIIAALVANATGLWFPLEYPAPFDSVSILFTAAHHLVDTSALSTWLSSVFGYAFVWFVAGLVTGAISKPGWNTVRSAIWVGGILATLAVASMFLLDPSLWLAPERNTLIVQTFVAGVVAAQLTLVTAMPLAMIISSLRNRTKTPLPTSIVTVCECGAVFKSKPMFCSRCGRRLQEPQTKQAV